MAAGLSSDRNNSAPDFVGGPAGGPWEGRHSFPRPRHSQQHSHKGAGGHLGSTPPPQGWRDKKVLEEASWVVVLPLRVAVHPAFRGGQASVPRPARPLSSPEGLLPRD